VLVVSGAVPAAIPKSMPHRAADSGRRARGDARELMRFRYSIAVAGTHGKTTTTSLVASILAEGGEDPTFVIGGRLKSAGSHARLGAAAISLPRPTRAMHRSRICSRFIAIVTNIDNDHLSTHGGDFELLKQSFVEFLHNLPFYGLACCATTTSTCAVSCARWAGRSCLTASPRRRHSRGQHPPQRTADALRRAAPSGGPLDVTVNLPGTHTCSIRWPQSLSPPSSASTIRPFNARSPAPGIDGRLQHVADVETAAGRVTIVDDYGHHPTEVTATLEALRQGYRAGVSCLRSNRIATPARMTS